MHLVPLSSIFIPSNRQRREFPQEPMNELSDSIRVRGLYHPIVVAPEADRYRLVAGERRFRAISSLAELDITFTCGTEVCQAGFIPVTLLSELDPLTLREIELEENTIRLDLTWAERAAAIADLDSLRREQSSTHTATDTARELFGYGTGSSVTKVNESILLSRALKTDPEIAKAKSHSEAMKLLTKKREKEHRSLLASTITVANYNFELLEGDARDRLTDLPSGKYQCILSDPPYGINADDFGSQAGTAHTYRDDAKYALECYRALATEGFRACASSAHAYIFCSYEMFADVAIEFALAGWEVWPRPLIWDKGNGMLPKPEFGPRYVYECILFANKGQRPVLLAGQHDVLRYAPPAERIHAAEKPVDLLCDLLNRTCLPGDTVLDAFAGSGPIFTAGARLKLRVTGIELDPEHIASCKLRIKEAL